jgi:ATP-dependent DNA ligase
MAWLKYKINKAQAFVIGGYTPDNPLDAAIVGYYEGDKLMFVSKVWNGFVPRLRREVWSKLLPSLCKPAGGETHALGLYPRNRCTRVWIRPHLIAQIK